MNTLTALFDGVETRRCPALRRTHLTVYGAVDGDRVEELQAVIAEALGEGHVVTIDLHHLTSVERCSLEDLLDLVMESTQP